DHYVPISIFHMVNTLHVAIPAAVREKDRDALKAKLDKNYPGFWQHIRAETSPNPHHHDIWSLKEDADSLLMVRLIKSIVEKCHNGEDGFFVKNSGGPREDLYVQQAEPEGK